MKSFFGLVAVLFTFSSFGQILNPVKWSWKAVPAGKDEYKLQFTATIDKGWHTYSQFQGNDGAVPTSFKYEPNKSVTLVGKSTETCAKTHEGIDDVFGVFQKSFEEKVVFEQLVKISGPTTLKGSFEFMVCDNKTCLPPDTKSFSFDLFLADGEGIKKKTD
mgnify:FL=1